MPKCCWKITKGNKRGENVTYILERNIMENVTVLLI